MRPSPMVHVARWLCVFRSPGVSGTDAGQAMDLWLVEFAYQQIAASHSFFGGAERDRTADLLVANEALSQLSYSPPPDTHRTPLLQAQCRRTTSSSVPVSATRLKPRTPASLPDLAHPPRHCCSRRQRLLHHMPHLARSIRHYIKHWNN
jgi:hypothetical protein